MQLIVVAAVMPLLLLLSCARSAYIFLRMGGAAFAGIAAIGWIVERLFSWQTRTDAVVNWVAQRAVAVAPFLFTVCFLVWLIRWLSPTSPLFTFLSNPNTAAARQSR